MSYQEAMYTERKMGMQEGEKLGFQKGKTEERNKLEKKLREKGMSGKEIKAILAD